MKKMLLCFVVFLQILGTYPIETLGSGPGANDVEIFFVESIR